MRSWWPYLKQIFIEPPEAPECDHWRAAPPAFKPDPRFGSPERSAARAQHPILRSIIGAPTRDAFKAWRDDPTTRFAFAALDTAANAQKEAWSEISWEAGDANPILLTELRTRADAYSAMQEAEYESFCEWLGVEPEPLPEDDADGDLG